MKSSVLKTLTNLEMGKSQRDVELFGASPPGFFVGYEGYPQVRVGPLVPVSDEFQENPHLLDAPEVWFGTPLEQIVRYRSTLARTNFQIKVFQPGRKFDDLNLDLRRLLETSQELAMASRPVDTETHLKSMRVGVQFDDHAIPMGPSGLTDKITIAENTPVHPTVDKVVDDVDLRAGEAIFSYLYDDARLEISQIQRIFSAGLLGEKRARKLVPTRWAITAVDDIVGKGLISQIKKYPQINEYEVYRGEYLDNKFTILLVPGPWSFEMMEVWAANSVWNQVIPGVQDESDLQENTFSIVRDHEFERGRTTYASHVTGAYYAARTMVAEYLERKRRQARAIVFREVTEGYLLPLGVWVIRETVKDVFERQKFIIKTDNLTTALEEGLKDHRVPLKDWYHASKLLPFLNRQKTLDAYFKK